jgi:hypothetical protein
MKHKKGRPRLPADYNWRLCKRYLPFTGTNLNTKWRVENEFLTTVNGTQLIRIPP